MEVRIQLIDKKKLSDRIVDGTYKINMIIKADGLSKPLSATLSVKVKGVDVQTAAGKSYQLSLDIEPEGSALNAKPVTAKFKVKIIKKKQKTVKRFTK